MTSENDLIVRWLPTVEQSNHIFTWTETLTMCWLADKASKATLAIETGVYMGRTSKVMLDARVGHLWSIDPFMVDGTRRVTEYFLRDEIREGRCEIIPKFTKPATEMLQHLAGTVDLAFIDDGHAYEDVITDITCILPLVRSGGIIAGHDYETSPENDVARAVRKLLPGHTEECPRLWVYIKP